MIDSAYAGSLKTSKAELIAFKMYLTSPNFLKFDKNVLIDRKVIFSLVFLQILNEVNECNW